MRYVPIWGPPDEPRPPRKGIKTGGIIFLAALALTGCAGDAATRATTSLAVACDVYSGVLSELTPMRVSGRLSAATVARVDAVNVQVVPLCGVGSIVDPAAGVRAVNGAIASIRTIKGEM